MKNTKNQSKEPFNAHEQVDNEVENRFSVAASEQSEAFQLEKLSTTKPNKSSR